MLQASTQILRNHFSENAAEKNCYTDIKYFSGNFEMGKLMIRYSCKVASIWNVEISPKFRGKGHGQKMMQEALDFILQNYPDCVQIYLNVVPGNHRAIHIYEKLGFKYATEAPRNYSEIDRRYWHLWNKRDKTMEILLQD